MVTRSDSGPTRSAQQNAYATRHALQPSDATATLARDPMPLSPDLPWVACWDLCLHLSTISSCRLRLAGSDSAWLPRNTTPIPPCWCGPAAGPRTSGNATAGYQPRYMDNTSRRDARSVAGAGAARGFGGVFCPTARDHRAGVFHGPPRDSRSATRYMPLLPIMCTMS